MDRAWLARSPGSVNRATGELQRNLVVEAKSCVEERRDLLLPSGGGAGERV